MKKIRSTRKLVLHTETVGHLQQLELSALREAHGGAKPASQPDSVCSARFSVCGG